MTYHVGNSLFKEWLRIALMFEVLGLCIAIVRMRKELVPRRSASPSLRDASWKNYKFTKATSRRAELSKSSLDSRRDRNNRFSPFTFALCDDSPVTPSPSYTSSMITTPISWTVATRAPFTCFVFFFKEKTYVILVDLDADVEHLTVGVRIGVVAADDFAGARERRLGHVVEVGRATRFAHHRIHAPTQHAHRQQTFQSKKKKRVN